jgi:hypothetical protein
MPERLSATEAAATARLMWTLFEPVHVVTYLAAAAAASTPARVAELAGLLRPVARACAAALPFPSGIQA